MAKILIVDDDEKMVMLYHDVLSIEGFDVLTSTNGEDGLRLAIKEVPNLILLDVMMPGMGGEEVIDYLLRNEKTKNIPIIFLTSLVTEEEIINSKGKIGGRLYISKSTNKKEFVKRIKEALGNR